MSADLFPVLTYFLLKEDIGLVEGHLVIIINWNHKKTLKKI